MAPKFSHVYDHCVHVDSPDAPCILIIDDNVEFADLLGTLISEQGLRATVSHTAQDGFEQLTRAEPLAVLVDLLLPDMTGHNLLAKIARQGPPPPLFVMSGVFRGAEQRARVEKIVPILGWYEKPFDTRLLVEQIARLVGQEVKDRRAHQRVGEITGDFDINILAPMDAAPLGPIALAIEVDIDIDIEIEESAPQWEGATEVSTTVPRHKSNTSSAPFDGLTSGFGREHSASPAEVAAGLRTSLRTGALETTTMPRLLNAFYVAQETGEIVFERGNARKIVYFESGAPSYAVSNQDTERLGVIVKRAAGLSNGQIDTAVKMARGTDKLTGDVLVQLGYIDEEARAEMLAEQTRAIIRSLFLWETGRYVIGFKVRTQLNTIELSEDTAGLVVGGVRDLFELSRLQRLLPSELRPKPSPNPPFELYQLPLTDPEGLLLLKTTGDLNVMELAELMFPRLDERGVRAQIYSLLTLGILVAE